MCPVRSVEFSHDFFAVFSETGLRRLPSAFSKSQGAGQGRIILLYVKLSRQRSRFHESKVRLQLPPFLLSVPYVGILRRRRWVVPNGRRRPRRGAVGIGIPICILHICAPRRRLHPAARKEGRRTPPGPVCTSRYEASPPCCRRHVVGRCADGHCGCQHCTRRRADFRHRGRCRDFSLVQIPIPRLAALLFLTHLWWVSHRDDVGIDRGALHRRACLGVFGAVARTFQVRFTLVAASLHGDCAGKEDHLPSIVQLNHNGQRHLPAATCTQRDMR